MRKPEVRRRAGLLTSVITGIAVTFLALAPAHPQQPKSGQIEKLLAEGWEIAGYLAASDSRTLILFRHKQQSYLVQCSVLIDVTRSPRVVTNCYEIR